AAGVRWGSGKTATFTARANIGGNAAGEDMEVLRVFPGSFQVAFGRFTDEQAITQFRSRLAAITELEVSGVGTWPWGELTPGARGGQRLRRSEERKTERSRVIASTCG